MELTHYLSLNNISTTVFAKQLGISSRMTLYRYSTGMRFPSASVLAQIVELTNGLVTAADFTPRSTVAKPRKKRCAANDALPENPKDLSSVVQTALDELGDRARYQAPNQFWLDNRPVALPQMIASANLIRQEKGVEPLRYPLINPIHHD
jgi:hypothetical protein